MENEEVELRFRTGDDLFTWVLNCHAAGETLWAADDPLARTIGYRIAGVYGFITLPDIREHNPTRKVMSRFRPRYDADEDELTRTWAHSGFRTWLCSFESVRQ
jgi:hypothetical protein